MHLFWQRIQPSLQTFIIKLTLALME